MTIKEYGKKIYNNAVAHGFYEGVEDETNPIWLSNRLMLIVSELGEALEALRNNNYSAEPKSGGFTEELADACIRIFDLAFSLGVDLEGAIVKKMKYNESRPYKHARAAL